MGSGTLTGGGLQSNWEAFTVAEAEGEAAMPGQAGYGEADALLAANWDERANEMRRVRLGAAELRDAWPDSPLWRAELPVL